MSLFRFKKKILVVEDEPDIADGIEARLQLSNYTVIKAENGQKAVEFARAKKPDLIILDIMLPRLDGFDVIQILRSEKRTQEIPILVLTALQMVGDINKAFSMGANDYLPKPFTNAKLLSKVVALLNPSDQ